ncbi:MAG TPA: ATP-binding protein [Lachnospiraceae bacterium]|nr:ATP-binding protein [Lachnospiraceae bacterium]
MIFEKIVKLVLEFIPSLFENFIILSFLSNFFGFKKSITKVQQIVILITGTMVLTAIAGISSLFLYFEGIFIILPIIICIAYGVIFLRGNLLNYAFMSLIPFIVIAIVNAFTIYGVSRLANVSMYHAIVGEGMTRVVIVLITKSIFLFIIKVLEHLNPKSSYHLKKREWISIISVFIASLTIAVFIMDVYINRQNYLTDKDNLFFLGSIVGLIIINVVTYFSFITIGKENEAKIQYEMTALQLEQQKRSMEEMKKNYNEVRKLKHDLKNYLEGCLALLRTNKYDYAQDYLEDICAHKIKPINMEIVTENDLVNAILNNKLHLCKKYNIDVDYEIAGNLENYSELDICILIGNMWDNAIEATKLVEKSPRIEFVVKNSKNYLVIIMRNTLKKSVLKSNPMLKTTKKDKNSHGIGLISIEDIVNKYDGMLNYREENNVFELQITLKNGFL